MNIDISKEQPGAVEPDAEESDATAAEVDDGAVTADSSQRRAPVAVTAVAVGALVVALVTALWFGAGWARSALFTDGPRVEARDSALDAARQAAINMTSMKLDDIPGSLALARSSMTGAILESAQKNQQQSEQMAAQSGVGMQAKVLGASLTALNSENDKATALVVLQITETKADKSASDYRYTWSLDMTKVGDVWKAEQVASLAQPVLLNGPGPTGLGQPAQQSGAEQPSQAPTPAPLPGS
ncbi:hypothetical protein [Nocardia arizonensis]|uniref:hypothetical protein n=1 Tax=Nocardia arizonensis TaxID=1141647 RepID=UPI0012E13BD8|nr:hypothetical protein [Nocardia arizonensis]